MVLRKVAVTLAIWRARHFTSVDVNVIVKG
jgi:hypothetical protein